MMGSLSKIRNERFEPRGWLSLLASLMATYVCRGLLIGNAQRVANGVADPYAYASPPPHPLDPTCTWQPATAEDLLLVDQACEDWNLTPFLLVPDEIFIYQLL